MKKWAVIVVRSNGQDVDVLHQLCDARDEALAYAKANQERWVGVSLEIVEVLVPLQGEPVLCL